MAGKNKTKRNLLGNEDGTTGVLFGLLAVPMLALVGTAVDVARVIKTRDTVQTAMDSAMLAAGKVAADQQPAVAATFFNSNAGHVPKVKVAFTVGADGNLNGQATATDRTPFSGSMMGRPTMSVIVKAKTRPQTTTLVNTERVPCIHAMDQSGSRTLWLDSNSALNATSCDVRVRSNASDGVYENASSDVKFGMIRVKGASSITSGYAPATFSIVNEPYRVKDGEAIVSDPYSRYVDEVRSQINVGACNGSYTNKTVSNNATPGTYCGATEFKNVTFAPGL